MGFGLSGFSSAVSGVHNPALAVSSDGYNPLDLLRLRQGAIACGYMEMFVWIHIPGTFTDDLSGLLHTSMYGSLLRL